MRKNKVKPQVELNKLENTVVNAKTIEEFDNLMKISELVGWKWESGYSPRQGNLVSERWEAYKERICVCISNGELSYGPKNTYKKTLSFQQFCDMNNLTQEKLNDLINKN